MEIADVLARNVQRYRLARGIGLRELGRRVGGKDTGSHMSKIEAGEVQNVGLLTLDLIAKALNVSICDLVEGGEALDTVSERVSDQALRVASLLQESKMERPEDFLARLVRLPADAQLLVDELMLGVEHFYRERAKRERRFRLAESNITEKLNILGKVAELPEDYEVDGNGDN